jgi:uncharacterized protein
MAQFRILSLDGGGSWALIQIKALINLFSPNGTGTDVNGHQVLRKFDLVIGNSGGTITLGGLLMDKPLAEILGYFENADLRGQIFATASVFRDPASFVTEKSLGVGYKYNTQAKLAGLKSIMGPLSESPVSAVPAMLGPNYRGSKTNVVLCAFDYDRNRETFFRSDLASLSGASRLDVSIMLAIHTSSNAPVNYFDAPAETPVGRYWDGAIGGYNNPVFAGVVEALANATVYGTSRAEICALSLGTGSVVLPLQRHIPHENPILVSPAANWNLPNDIKKLAASIIDDPPDAASFHAHIVLGGPLPPSPVAPATSGRIMRMSPLVQPFLGDAEVPWMLPPRISAADFQALVNLDSDATAQADVDRISAFADQWIAGEILNQPIQADPLTLVPRVGHRFYAEAKQAWSAL